VKGWVILIVTLAVGFVLGVGAAMRGPEFIAPYIPKSVGGSGEHLDGQVVRKQRDGNRLLVKVTTTQGPMLVSFTQKAADLDVLLDPGDTVTFITKGYATFVDDPGVERVKGSERTASSPAAVPAGPTAPAVPTASSGSPTAPSGSPTAPSGSPTAPSGSPTAPRR
jgi:hypothetical protein